MDNKKTIAIALVALVAGALAGYFLAPAQDTGTVPETDGAKRRKPRTHVVDEGDKASVAALRRRVRELEQRLAVTVESALAFTNGVPMDTNRPAARTFGPPGPGEWRARLEEMKVNDPERYAQMTNRMAQWRSRSLANTQDRLDFFASLDTSTMTDRQRENHERLQELLARREELMQTMDFGNTEVSDADREKARQEMHGLFRQIHSLEEAERDMLLNQAARNLGCKGTQARELVDTIKTIYRATQSFGGGRRGPGPGGPPPGGRR